MNKFQKHAVWKGKYCKRNTCASRLLLQFKLGITHSQWWHWSHLFQHQTFKVSTSNFRYKHRKPIHVCVLSFQIFFYMTCRKRHDFVSILIETTTYRCNCKFLSQTVCHKKTLTINESFYIFKLIPTLRHYKFGDATKSIVCLQLLASISCGTRE